MNRSAQARISTGIEGLDLALDGGLPLRRTYLVEGAPGTGKTTLALQMLAEALRHGRRALIVSVAQTEEDLNVIATSHGLDLNGLTVISPDLDSYLDTVSVSTDEANLQTLLNSVEEALRTAKPDVFVFDSLLEMRLLSASQIDFRKRLLRLKRICRDLDTTALLLDHTGTDVHGGFERGTVHGVIHLQAAAPTIGQINRTLTIVKMRGTAFREGQHDFRIRAGGLEVFPRVIPSERNLSLAPNEAQLKLSEPTLNEILGGGLEFGTSVLIAGQSGSGKSTLATLIASSAAAAGHRAALFLFEERPEVYRTRSDSLGLKLTEFERSGALTLMHFDPAEISPGALSRQVIGGAVDGASVVILDSLTGYIAALPERESVETHLHALVQYLTRQGCLVVVTVAQTGLMGEPPVSDINASIIADAVLMLRQQPEADSIRRSVAVLKKRHSDHERGIQELLIRPGEVSIKRTKPAQ